MFPLVFMAYWGLIPSLVNDSAFLHLNLTPGSVETTCRQHWINKMIIILNKCRVTDLGVSKIAIAPVRLSALDLKQTTFHGLVIVQGRKAKPCWHSLSPHSLRPRRIKSNNFLPCLHAGAISSAGSFRLFPRHCSWRTSSLWLHFLHTFAFAWHLDALAILPVSNLLSPCCLHDVIRHCSLKTQLLKKGHCLCMQLKQQGSLKWRI